MNQTYWKTLWQQEEDAAQIHGWDFSHIHGRYQEEQDLPWDYEAIVRRSLRRDDALLDFDTGGGEFLLSLHHPHSKTWATEGYPPQCCPLPGAAPSLGHPLCALQRRQSYPLCGRVL